MPLVPIQEFFKRTKEHRALGLLYNVPEKDLSWLQFNTKRTNRVIVDLKQSNNRSLFLNAIMKQINYKEKCSLEFMQSYAVNFLKDKMLVVYHADLLGDAILKILEKLTEEKISVLMVFNNGGLIRLRKSEMYSHVLTIEKDYSTHKNMKV